MAKFRKPRRLNPTLLLASKRSAADLNIDRRTFLLSAGAVAVAGTASKAATQSLSGIAGFELKATPSAKGGLKRVSIKSAAGNEWVLDANLFEDAPTLTQERIGNRLIISLTGARFPGTPLQCNLEAVIEPQFADHTITLRFWGCGANGGECVLKGSLQPWLDGTKDLTAPLSAQSMAQWIQVSSGTAVKIDSSSPGKIAYSPKGVLELNGSFKVVWNNTNEASAHLGEPITCDRISLGVAPRSKNTFVSGTDKRHSNLSFRRASGSPWNKVLEIATSQAWTVAGSLSGFKEVKTELHESGPNAILLEDGSDFKVHSEYGTEFPLEDVQLAQLLGTADNDLILAASLSDDPQWLHQSGFSVLVGPSQGERFVVRTGRSGNLLGEPKLESRQIAAHIEGAAATAIVDSVAPLDIELQRPTPRPVPRPVPTPRPMPAPAPVVEQKPIVIQRIPVKVTEQPPIAANVGVGLDILEVLRREDMLALTFQFVNLKVTNAGLVRGDANRAAYVIVHFPPQALTEDSFVEDSTTGFGLPNSFKPGIPTRLSNPSRIVFFIPWDNPPVKLSLTAEGGLLDWSKWSPSVASTAVSSYAAKWIKVNPSLVSPVKTGTLYNFGAMTKVNPTPPQSLLYIVRQIRPVQTQPVRIQRAPASSQQVPTTGNGWQLEQVSPGIDYSKIYQIIPTGRVAVGVHQTAIEMPTWLTISPDERQTWFHSRAAESIVKGKFTLAALWHTRLGAITTWNDQAVEVSDDGRWFYTGDQKKQGPFRSPAPLHPTMRAIDSFDYEGQLFGKPIPEIVPYKSGVVTPTINRSNRRELVDNMTYRTADSTDSTPFEVERMMLTALGGYLKGEWNYRPGTQPFGRSGAGPGLISWRQVSTLGREHYVKLAFRGFLYPTMHQAVLVQISERKFQYGSGGIYAVLRTRQYIMVVQPTSKIDPGVAQRSLGFQSITCHTKVSPTIDQQPIRTSWGASAGMAEDTALWILVGQKPFEFQMTGVDMDGQEISWGQPSVFVHWNPGFNLPGSAGGHLNMAALCDLFTTKAPPGPAGTSAWVDINGQHVAFAPGDPSKPHSSVKYPCSSMQLSATGTGVTPVPLRAIPNFRPVLVQAKINVPAIQALQGSGPAGPQVASLDVEAFESDIAWAIAAAEAAAVAYPDGGDFKDTTVALSDVYKKSGFDGSKNPSETFLDLASKKAAEFKDASKAGGIINPNFNVGALSRIKGPIGASELVAGISEVDVSNYVPNVKAMLLGAVNIWDILPKKIQIGGDTPESPKLVVKALSEDGKDKPPTGVAVELFWSPTIHNAGLDPAHPIFVAEGIPDKIAGWPSRGTLTLDGSVVTKFKNPTPKFKIEGKVEHFRIDAIAPASVIWLDVAKIGFTIESGKDPKIEIDIPRITFVGPLAFVQTLQDLLNPGGSGLKLGSADTELALAAGSDIGFKPYFNVDLSGITAGFTITVPSVSVGILAIRNISLGGSIHLPFIVDPLRVRFNFCERNNPFQLSVWGITGGGFIAIALGLDGLEVFEGSLEFGACVSIDLGVASGSVSLMAGLYFKIEKDKTTLTGYVRLNGELSVIGIISVSLTFMLSLTYEKSSGHTRLYGTATLTVEVSVLFFSASVDVTVQKEIAGSDSSGSALMASNDTGMFGVPSEPPIPFTKAVSQDQWSAYCGAFGA